MPQLFPVKLPPGIYANGTEYDAKGRWHSASLVRWYNGKLRPVGGWQRFTTAPLDFPARGLFTWRDNNANRFLAAGTANSLYAHDGGTLYDITPTGLSAGNVDSMYGTGWGSALYGQTAYGTPSTSNGLILEATVWSLDAFGQYLVACSPADGRAWVWTGTSEAQATVMPNAPIGNRGLFVTDEHMVVLLGAGSNPRNVQWCAQGDYTTWTPLATNTAGSLQINSVGILMSAARYVSGQYLLFTDIDVHAMTYIAQPYVYGITRVGEKCGILGRYAKANVNGVIVWMGPSNFFMYDGAVHVMPCDVQEYVFNNINTLQGAKCFAGVNSQFSEVWFFYASAASSEIDSYVIWNYKENLWSVGQLARSAWADRDAWPFAVGAGIDCNLYQHEQGWTNSGVSRVGQVYAETGPIELGNGDYTMDVSRLLLDCNPGDAANLSLSFTTRDNPQMPEVVYGPYQNPAPNGEIPTRFCGRQVKLKVGLQADGPFDFGTLRMDVQQGSKR
jgi:hypothetical protein